MKRNLVIVALLDRLVAEAGVVLRIKAWNVQRIHEFRHRFSRVAARPRVHMLERVQHS